MWVKARKVEGNKRVRKLNGLCKWVCLVGGKVLRVGIERITIPQKEWGIASNRWCVRNLQLPQKERYNGGLTT